MGRGKLTMGKKTPLYSGGNNPTVTPLFSPHRAVLLLSRAVLPLVAAVLPRPPAVLPHRLSVVEVVGEQEGEREAGRH